MNAGVHEKKTFKFIIEHMEPEISEWVRIEYENMISKVGDGNLLLTGLQSDLKRHIETSGMFGKGKAILSEESVESFPAAQQKRVVLLDPKAPKELCPSDAAHFDYLLFGGILGDDPPQDRTGILRRMGFETRHLGPVQMTTDTAVVVADQVVNCGRTIESISFVDHPDVVLGRGESVTLPFRFIAASDHVLGQGQGQSVTVSNSVDASAIPILAPGLKEHLKKQNDEAIEF